MIKQNDFFNKFFQFSINNIFNQHFDNYSKSRFGKEKKNRRKVINRIAKKYGYISTNEKTKILKKISKHSQLISNAEYLYSVLEDKYSKDLLIQVLAYRLLGYKKVKLPMNTSDYFKSIKLLDKNTKIKNNSIDSGYNTKKLNLYNINFSEFNCKMYYTAASIYHQFVSRQYNYKKKSISAKSGDFVIDAGACWGDTALYFASLVEKEGKVFSFEFLPENVNVFKKNISINENIKDRIFLIEKPLLDKSDEDVFCSNNGPGNSITYEEKIAESSYKTISIDDFVNNEKIEKIDFIKMDIEGSELKALQGAEKTLKKYKPTLAISVYHKESDFYDIPNYLISLNIGYKYYFDHYSIHNEESVLFATVNNVI